MQQEFFGIGTLQKVNDILLVEKPSSIFLVTGKESYKVSGAKYSLEPHLQGFKIVHFNDFSVNPSLDDVKRGVHLFQEKKCDFVIAIGGGSVIDMAKTINIVAAHEGDPEQYITQKSLLTKKGRPLIAIPTTAGTGSESTHFSTIYIQKKKYSLEHYPFLIPDYAILDPTLTLTTPPLITASVGMDVLSQAVESYWSSKSTDESQKYAKEAIRLVLSNLQEVVNNPSIESRTNMLKASNLAGKAINLSKTTACHAISYHFTSHFGVPHGHACALTLGEIFVHNSLVNDKDYSDPRGKEYVQKVIQDLILLFEVNTADQACQKINQLMDSIGLFRSIKKLGIDTPEKLTLILKNGFHQQRMKNNPRYLNEEQLRKILERII